MCKSCPLVRHPHTVSSHHLLQLNLSTENNRAYSGRKIYHQMSRLHRMLNIEWNGHDDCTCARVKTLNISSPNFFPVLDTRKRPKSSTASLIWGPVCPSKILPSNEMNSSTI